MSLEALVRAGDAAGLVTWLDEIGPSGRKGTAKAAKALFKSVNTFDSDRDRVAAATAWLAVYACEPPAAAGWVAWAPDADAMVALTRRLQPPGLGAFVEKILPRSWGLAATLVEAGLAPRPPERLWALGMMVGAVSWNSRDAFVRWKPVLLRDLHLIFRHEGEGEFSLSAFSGRAWHDQLLDWAADGTLRRDTLIDLALGALLSGFATGRQPFFTQLLDALAPTQAEWDEHRASLVRLLASAASPTVGWAVGVLAEPLRRGEISAADLETVVTTRAAGTARAGIEALARRADDPEVPRVAAAGLGHPDASVQEAAAEVLLARCDEMQRAAWVAPWRAGLHPRVARRLGATLDATPVATPVQPISPLSPSRALAPFTGDDHALLDAIAAWVERPVEVDVGETLLAELATRPRPEAEAVRHAQALARAWSGRTLPHPGALLALVTRAWALGERVPAPPRSGWSSGRLYEARAVALADALVAGDTVAWLSRPTHRGGHLAADIALARWQARTGRVLPADLALCWARLSGPRPAPPPDDGDPLTAGWRFVLGSAPANLPLPLAVAAAHARVPQGDLPAPEGPWRTRVGEPRRLMHTLGGGAEHEILEIDGDFLTERPWWRRAPQTGDTEARCLVPGPEGYEPVLGGMAHDRAAVPDRPEAWYARAVHALICWFGSSEVDSRRPDVVAVLHDDASPLGTLGHLVVAAALSSAHASVRTAAVDLVLVALADGRLDPAVLGGRLAWLLSGDFLPAGRVVGAFADVVAAGHAAAVRDAWCAALPALGPVRDLAKLLDQLEAVLLVSPRSLPAPTQEALRGVSGGRAAKTARRILAS